MRQILDLDRWPLDDLGGAAGQALVARCREELRDVGMFSVDAVIRPEALKRVVAEVAPVLDTAAFTHSRDHNIYFDDEIDGLAPGPSGLEALRHCQPHDLRGPGPGERHHPDLRVAAAHRLPRRGNGEVQALPDG